ncbi:PKD domain-containing protein [Alteromonas macleodii str. 'English Channel 673']|uniref:PKD domain-containing protein n=1 Tax=Alteromonas macleodii (strain English Channel 673) TaxID=1004788 RepID=A0AB32ZYJ5_ALTME|nr:fibronectin type III domain-containing protein [Alteromonas macleodii]AFT74451.1 PKD domain-containing protein [Alteromonas macleodii str. 'English Channel 673']
MAETVHSFSDQESGSPLPQGYSTVEGGWQNFGNNSGLTPTSTSGLNVLGVPADFTEGYFEATLRARDTSNTTYASLRFRYQDDDNNWLFQWRASDGAVRFVKRINGVNTIFTEVDTTVQGNGAIATLRVSISDDTLTPSVNGQVITGAIVTDPALNTFQTTHVRISEQTYAIMAVAYDNVASGGGTGGENGPDDPLPALTMHNIEGFARQYTKAGKIFDNHSANVTDREYWIRLYETKDWPNWPHEQYPVVAESSSDHANGTGAILLRVYEETGQYDLTHAPSWHEWQEISNLPVFDHIATKTGAIYSDPNQSETPSRITKDGVIYSFFHGGGVTVGGVEVQATKRMESVNGVDFTNVVTTDIVYDPNLLGGNGHVGYQVVGKNVVSEIPYTYITTGLHGGGNDQAGQSQGVWGSNDLESWELIQTHGKMRGYLGLYSGLSDGERFYNVYQFHSMKKEGAYYRALYSQRNPSAGGQATNAIMAEILVNDKLEAVSAPHFFLEPTVGGFDERQVGDVTELEYAGRTFAFYVTRNANDFSEIGAAYVEHVPHTWEIARPLSNKTTLLSLQTNGSALSTGVTSNQALGFKAESGNDMTVLPLPANGDEALLTFDTTINPYEHEYIDIYFDFIGKDSADDINLAFGIADDVANPSQELKVFWPAASTTSNPTRATKMQLRSLGATSDLLVFTDNYFGQSDSWRSFNDQGDEAPAAKHTVGLRLVPSEKKVYMLQGSAEKRVYSTAGMIFNQAFTLFVKANLETTQAQNSSVSLVGVRVISSTDEVIAVPAAPMISASKSSDSVTVSSSTVPGATGYKYFLDNQQNETGAFTGLEPETTYTVYARASNALGDSAPSTIQTVTTDAAIPVNQPPTANVGPDQSIAAATQFTLDGAGSQDTDGTIVDYRWTQTAGDTVALNLEDPARPTATAPSKTTAQRLTFQLVTVDDEGAVSSPSLVNIDVAAVVQNDVLNIIDKISFTFESDGMITAFPGRANRETFRLKPSDPTGLVLEDGWFDFEANDVRRVEISMLETTGVKIISTDTDSITRERSKLHVRMGDMPIKSSTKEFEPTVSVFVGDDERGVVMTAPGLSGAPKVKYYSTTARAV